MGSIPIRSSLLRKKIFRKKELNILKIRHIEVNYLRENGFDWAVKRSYSRKPTYYVVEERNALKALNEFRKSIKAE